jgi:hypothetical protein
MRPCSSIHRTVLLGVFVGTKHQRRGGVLAFVKRDHFGQIQIDERVGIDHDKTAVLQECFGLKPAAGIEKLAFFRVHDV